MAEEAPAHDAISLIVVDASAPWVQSLFQAMPDGVRVWWFKPLSLKSALKHPFAALRGGQWRAVTANVRECRVIVPGWRRFPKWSTRVMSNKLRALIQEVGQPAAIVYTLPFHSGVASELAEYPGVYFAYDPYVMYDGWDDDVIAAGEAVLLRRCRAAFAISTALADDFRQRTDKPVFVQSNGLPRARLDACNGSPARPSDLPTGSTVVGCVGQIGSAYDWPLLADVVAKCPSIQFVFIGPMLPMPAADRAQADSVFKQPNVLHLGYREPEALPAYLTHMDALFSPLAVTPLNNRRSLLRIYDYLATAKPIISTPVASAVEHAPHIQLAETPEAFTTALRRATESREIDLVTRRAYLANHTWQKRAEQFLHNLRATGLPGLN